MKLNRIPPRKPRIEMLPFMDCVFLLLVYFVYSMLSMAVHRGVTLSLPTSAVARIDQKLVLSVSLKADGSVYLDQQPIEPNALAQALADRAKDQPNPGVLLFADKDTSYQKLFRILDIIQQSGLERISLQAQLETES
jgi:biopolymer transport protein ExbD